MIIEFLCLSVPQFLGKMMASHSKIKSRNNKITKVYKIKLGQFCKKVSKIENFLFQEQRNKNTMV